MADSRKKKLRIIDYLSPGIPIEFFDVLRQYLEFITGLESILIYESRWCGPQPHHADPFTLDEVDISFMCPSSFIRLTKENNQFIELCKAAAIHVHDKAQNRPIFYSDLIIHKDSKHKYKELHDLKGHKWAYSDRSSLSGSLALLAELKRIGTSGQFFGHVIESGSHLKSIEMVMNKTVDGSSVDSSVLTTFKKQRPDLAAKLHTLQSLGPLPIYPVVLNKRLPDDLKEKITQGLLDLHTKGEWKQRLSEFNVSGFVPIDISAYNKEDELRDYVKDLSIAPAYY